MMEPRLFDTRLRTLVLAVMLLPTLNKEGAMAEAESTVESSTLLGTAIVPESA
jgi:hypothetical protein